MTESWVTQEKRYHKIKIEAVTHLQKLGIFGPADFPGWYHYFYAYSLASLNMKNFTSDTPLN